MAKTAAERQRDRRKKKQAVGTKEVLITLDAQAYATLKRKSKYQTISKTVCELLKNSSSKKVRNNVTIDCYLSDDGIYEPTFSKAKRSRKLSSIKKSL